MDYIVVQGVPPFDGRYELVLGEGLTTREWGWIKRLAGYLPLAVDDNAIGDPEFICVLVAIALRRAGKVEAAEVPAVFEQLADAPPLASFTIEAGEDEESEAAQASPPAQNSSENGGSFGADSATNLPPSLATIPPDSGTPESGFSAPGQATLGS